MLTMDEERLGEHRRHVREQATEELTGQVAGVLDAAINQLMHAKIRLVGFSSASNIYPTQSEAAAASGLVDCMMQSLMDEPPRPIEQVIGEFDPLDEIPDTEPLVDDVAQLYKAALKEAMQP